VSNFSKKKKPQARKARPHADRQPQPRFPPLSPVPHQNHPNSRKVVVVPTPRHLQLNKKDRQIKHPEAPGFIELKSQSNVVAAGCSMQTKGVSPLHRPHRQLSLRGAVMIDPRPGPYARKKTKKTYIHHRMPESLRAFWRMVSLTAAKTRRILVVSVAWVRLEFGLCVISSSRSSRNNSSSRSSGSSSSSIRRSQTKLTEDKDSDSRD
jgi:hypothetical protein